MARQIGEVLAGLFADLGIETERAAALQRAAQIDDGPAQPGGEALSPSKRCGDLSERDGKLGKGGRAVTPGPVDALIQREEETGGATNGHSVNRARSVGEPSPVPKGRPVLRVLTGGRGFTSANRRNRAIPSPALVKPMLSVVR